MEPTWVSLQTKPSMHQPLLLSTQHHPQPPPLLGHGVYIYNVKMLGMFKRKFQSAQILANTQQQSVTVA